MYDDICYEEPFLKEVVARVDFAASLTTLGTKIPAEVGNTAIERFPILEQRKALAQELQVSSGEIHHKREEFTEWNYHGRHREKRLVIAPDCSFVTYSQYTTYEALKDDFLSVMESLFKKYPDLRGRRLGLRFVNQIAPAGHDTIEWEDLIDEGLLGLFSHFKQMKESASRLFNIAEFKHHDDIQVKFQFGSPNPDFPATMRRPLFVLDIDAYLQGLQNIDEVSANLDLAHKYIQELFEQSITEELRELMHVRK